MRASVGVTSGSATPGAVARKRARQPVLRASLERWHLHRAVSREVVVPDGDRIAIIGGLGPDDVTTSRVTVLDIADGTSVAARPLARASHDAGGAVIAGRAMVFGGGSATSEDWIQQRTATGAWSVTGRLPTARSDLAAVTIGRSAYVLGGYDGAGRESSVLRVSRRAKVQVVGHLRVPVRYAAVAAVGSDIWVVGGLARSGPTGVIQRFDVATGHAAVVGRLRRPLAGASAVVLGGQVYVCGGVVGKSPVAQVLRLEPSTGLVTRAGRLPAPVSYAGATELGGAAYVVGGETPSISAGVMRLRVVYLRTSTHGRP
jgi:hypothetical protein